VAAVTPSRSAEGSGTPPLDRGSRSEARRTAGGGDPFDLFQIPPAFELDLEELGRRHRELSRALHPDRYVGRPAAERREALGRAIEVNEAWRVLRDPARRAEVLLQRLGVPTGEESNPPARPEFLMEMMERRESLRALGRAGDLAGVEALSEEVRGQERELLRELGEGFRRALETPEAPVPATLSLRLGELRYLRRFFDEADAFLSD
jgi:molecular chaperone HscB